MPTPHSLWWSTLDQSVQPRPPLQHHLDVDVAIVGGGFTGLWTARELLRRDPSLQVVVLEKQVCGHGASGRNGGWASALYPQGASTVVSEHGQESYDHLRHVLQDAVAGLGDAANADGIDAHFVHGGTLSFARNHVQAQRLHEGLDEARRAGVGESDLVWLDEQAARDRGAVAGALGALYSPHCARVNPARLVRGLSDSVEGLGARIFEHTAVTRIVAGRRGRQPEVVTAAGSVHARFVVRATEGYTPTLPGSRRAVAPIYSLMVATEPLARSFWDDVGFREYETFADARHLVIYGQRTRDDRIAFGGRGAPYHFASTVEDRFDDNAKVYDLLERTLHELFPALEADVTHRWGGPLAMPRDHSPSVQIDRDTGLASAGGYTGDGVVLSYVCANALADLITQPDTETEFTRLPFVQHHGRSWEYEPLRWMGINVGLGLATWADHHESSRDTPSRASNLVDRLFH
ncbi:MAG TPA: FAD-dependent oxidoreductase [Acidimicrobiales bacterium]|nr:FAD-dependent oxidoreductase [Acidimicrobiales bacterium]